MGLDYTTVLGPYVECRTNKVQASETKRICTNEQCQSYSDHVGDGPNPKFCPDCGTPIQEREFAIQEDNVNAHEVRELLGEALYRPLGDSFYSWMDENNVHIWLANRHIPGQERDFSFDPKEGSQTPVEITPDVIAAEKQRFCDFYEKELVILRNEYDEENVVVKWGLIHYIS